MTFIEGGSRSTREGGTIRRGAIQRGREEPFVEEPFIEGGSRSSEGAILQSREGAVRQGRDTILQTT